MNSIASRRNDDGSRGRGREPSRAVIAVFDLDGTLTTRDTLAWFFQWQVGRFRYALAIIACVPAALGAFARALPVREAIKTRLLRSIVGEVQAETLEQRMRGFVETVTRTALRPDVLSRLRWHQEQGHETWIVSASFEGYVKQIASALSVDHVIATRWEVDADGRLTGRLDGRSVRGRRKVELLRHQLGAREVYLYAYGDSEGDRELLEAADEATWVKRGGLARLVPAA